MVTFGEWEVGSGKLEVGSEERKKERKKEDGSWKMEMGSGEWKKNTNLEINDSKF